MSLVYIRFEVSIDVNIVIPVVLVTAQSSLVSGHQRNSSVPIFRVEDGASVPPKCW